MKKILLAALLIASTQAFAQSSKKGTPAKKTVARSSQKKAVAPSPLTLALVEMKWAIKDKMAERNEFVTAFVVQSYMSKVRYMYEVEEMLDKVPTNKESRDILLLALARRSGGREEMIIEQLYALGVRPANARLIAAYTIKLDSPSENGSTQETASSRSNQLNNAGATSSKATTKVPSSDDDEATSTAEETVVDNKVYTYVEQMPELPGGGGNAAIIAAIQKATKYPPLALRNQVEGRIFVSFTVDKNGAVSAIKIVKGLGSGLDEETIRAVSTLPQLIPGKQNGQPVGVSFTVPVTWAIQ